MAWNACLLTITLWDINGLRYACERRVECVYLWCAALFWSYNLHILDALYNCVSY